MSGPQLNKNSLLNFLNNSMSLTPLGLKILPNSRYITYKQSSGSRLVDCPFVLRLEPNYSVFRVSISFFARDCHTTWYRWIVDVVYLNRISKRYQALYQENVRLLWSCDDWLARLVTGVSHAPSCPSVCQFPSRTVLRPGFFACS